MNIHTYRGISIAGLLLCLLLPLFFVSHAASGQTPSTVLITEVYYKPHPNIKDEYIILYNPSSTPQDLTGYYLTTKPDQTQAVQPKIMFSDGMHLASHTRLILTQNASSFTTETEQHPDYEYDSDSQPDIPQLQTYKTSSLSNTGGALALKDSANTTLDLVLYGNTTTTSTGWLGDPINDTGTGVILRRNTFNDVPVDTDTRHDWEHQRCYGIGQSEFPPTTYTFDGELTVFCSPDNSYTTIIDELQNATTSVYINMYEFTHPLLYQELLNLHQRGVTVLLLLDGAPVGGISTDEHYIITHLEQAGIHIRLLQNNETKQAYTRYRFDHAKYLIIDNQTVIVESCNWALTGVPVNTTYGNREWGVVIRNPDVSHYFCTVFFDDWDPDHRDSVLPDHTDFSVPSTYTLDSTIPRGRYNPRFSSQTIQGHFSLIPVFSPDTSQQLITDALTSAQHSILVAQLSISQDWGDITNPFVYHLTEKAREGLDVKVLMNYNPEYKSTLASLDTLKQYLENAGVHVKYLYTNWSVFTNLHTKGIVIDNQTVLVSSINWNENSVQNNREAGVLITNQQAASYFSSIFYADWTMQKPVSSPAGSPGIDYKNLLCIAVVFLVISLIIYRDWRRRKWT